MTEITGENWNDPRRLFRLWKQLTGEDLLIEKEKQVKEIKK